MLRAAEDMDFVQEGTHNEVSSGNIWEPAPGVSGKLFVYYLVKEIASMDRHLLCIKFLMRKHFWLGKS